MGNHIMRLAVKYLVDEASSRGIEINMLDNDRFSMKLGDHIEYFDETLCSQTTSTAVEFCLNKFVTKLFMSRNGIQVPKGGVFTGVDEALQFSDSLRWPIVAKPCHGMEGELVFPGITNKDQLESILKMIFGSYKKAILEEHFDGEEYRVFATREKAISIVKRIPANVVGDGEHTIMELINLRNLEPRRQPGMNPLHQIEVDQAVLETLKSANQSLDDVPKAEERVFLRQNSNISTGGESVECSDIAHLSVGEIAVRAIQSIPGLMYGGVDFMTKDITVPQVDGNYVIIEVNSQPGLALHQDPSQGSPKDVAKVIIDLVFPESA